MTQDRSAAVGPETFEPLRGTEFSMQGEEAANGTIRLDEVTRHRSQPGAPRAEPFSLVFSGPPPVLEQRTYRLEHPATGELDIFLVPIGHDADGRFRYEAVFN